MISKEDLHMGQGTEGKFSHSVSNDRIGIAHTNLANIQRSHSSWPQHAKGGFLQMHNASG